MDYTNMNKKEAQIRQQEILMQYKNNLEGIPEEYANKFTEQHTLLEEDMLGNLYGKEDSMK